MALLRRQTQLWVANLGLGNGVEPGEGMVWGWEGSWHGIVHSSKELFSPGELLCRTERFLGPTWRLTTLKYISS